MIARDAGRATAPTPPPPPAGASFLRRHPLLAGFGVLAALSLFAAYWPLSAIVTGVVIAARASGADTVALGVVRRGAGRVIDRVKRWAGLDHDPAAEAPEPAGPAPARPAPAPAAPDPAAPAPAPGPVSVAPPAPPAGEAPPAPRPRRPRPPAPRRIDSAPARRSVGSAPAGGIELDR